MVRGAWCVVCGEARAVAGAVCLDDGVLAVDFPLVVLRDDLDLLAEILHLDEPHQLAPLVEDLEPVDARVLLLLRSSLVEHPLAHLLLQPQAVEGSLA